MSLNLNQVLDKGFTLFFGVVVIASVVWVGRRLLDKETGLVTSLVNKHIEFLDGLANTTRTMADSHERLAQSNEVICDNAERNTRDIARLERAAHHAVTILKHAATKMEIYDLVEPSLNEIDNILGSRLNSPDQRKPKND